MRNVRLNLTVFICGAAVMVLEMAGSRVLAPFLGTSIVVWTSLIAVILGALSLGYWQGGRMADRDPSPRKLGRIILLAAVFTALVAGTKALLLGFLQDAGSVHAVSIAACIALFAPPSVLLGMVSPYAARLAITDAATSGTAVGALYALSTVGSILGTFAAGFFLLGYLGTTSVLLATAASLVAASLTASPRDAMLKAGAAALIALGLAAQTAHAASLKAIGVYDTDTDYQRILVYDSRDPVDGQPTRVLVTGPGGKQSAMYLADPVELALPYTRHLRLARHFQPRLGRLLVLGGGAYSFPKYALAHYPGVRVDAVEIDPGVTAVAREHFHLPDDPRLRIVHQDARMFLNHFDPARDGSYDAVICDTFTSHYSIPFHLATVEAARRISDLLAPDGVAVVNCISAIQGDNGRFFRALLATYRQVFAEVRVYGVWGSDGPVVQNLILAAFKTKPGPEVDARQPEDTEIESMLSRRVTARIEDDSPPLTDDFAPVDRYTLPLALH